MHWAFLIINLALIAGWTSAERIQNSIYVPILQGGHFCFRRANGTHQFGCSSGLNGNVGVVHLLRTPSDVKWLTETGTAAPYMGKYPCHFLNLFSKLNDLQIAAMMFAPMFNYDDLKKLQDSGKVSGVLMLEKRNEDNTIDLPDRFSVDSTCPNSMSAVDGGECSTAQPWNVAGSDIANHNWEFPIIYIKDQNTTNFLIKDCFEKYNQPNQDGDWPHCAVELDSFMNQAVSSESCMRRQNILNPFSPTRWCDPLGDQSAFMLMTPTTGPETFQDDSVIVVSTRLDTMGLFDQLEIGSESPSTGIVVLLAVAELLSRTEVRYKDGVSNVLFAFLNGESFDYIGSSKMIYDMNEGQFPCTSNSGDSGDEDCEKLKDYDQKWPMVRPSSIRSYLDLGQLYSKSSKDLFAHVDTQFEDQEMVNSLKNSFKEVRVSQASDQARGLPPSSVHSLLKVRRKTPGVLLTNFDQKMTNNFYHSLYDNYTAANAYNHSLGPEQDIVQHLATVAESVASFVFYEATGTRTVFDVDRAALNDILNCFLNTSRCSMFARASTPELPPQKKHRDRPDLIRSTFKSRRSSTSIRSSSKGC